MTDVEKDRKNGWSPESTWDKRNEICFRQIYEQDAKNYYRSSASAHATKLLDLEQPAVDRETEAHNNGALQIINENELELTLGPSSNYNTSDSGVTQNSSSSTGSSHEGRRTDIKQVNKGQVFVENANKVPHWLEKGLIMGI